jgi:hypothetical protein
MYAVPLKTLRFLWGGLGFRGRGLLLWARFGFGGRFFFGRSNLTLPFSLAWGLGNGNGFFLRLFRWYGSRLQGFTGMFQPHREIQAATFADGRFVRLFGVAFGADHGVIIRGNFLKGLE